MKIKLLAILINLYFLNISSSEEIELMKIGSHVLWKIPGGYGASEQIEADGSYIYMLTFKSNPLGVILANKKEGGYIYSYNALSSSPVTVLISEAGSKLLVTLSKDMEAKDKIVITSANGRHAISIKHITIED